MQPGPALPALKFVAHSRTVLTLAMRHGWLLGARYTDLRDVRAVERLGFLDINWRDYYHSVATLLRPNRRVPI